MLLQIRMQDHLASPVDFTEVWNDRGSDAHTDVRVILWMNPHLSRLCVVGYHSLPDYRYSITYCFVNNWFGTT